MLRWTPCQTSIVSRPFRRGGRGRIPRPRIPLLQLSRKNSATRATRKRLWGVHSVRDVRCRAVGWWLVLVRCSYRSATERPYDSSKGEWLRSWRSHRSWCTWWHWWGCVRKGANEVRLVYFHWRSNACVHMRCLLGNRCWRAFVGTSFAKSRDNRHHFVNVQRARTISKGIIRVFESQCQMGMGIRTCAAFLHFAQHRQRRARESLHVVRWSATFCGHFRIGDDTKFVRLSDLVVNQRQTERKSNRQAADVVCKSANQVTGTEETEPLKWKWTPMQKLCPTWDSRDPHPSQVYVATRDVTIDLRV